VGHRTGLLDALAERDDATSEELAAEARLDERYYVAQPGALPAPT
jgi:hypothetical protein